MPVLDLWLLNVGHGDSIVLKYQSESGVAFGVVDSNTFGSEDPPALRLLRALGAKRLAFVMLTHPHADHFRGMLKILEAYRGKIDAFLSFPAGEYIRNNTDKLRPIFTKLAQAEGSTGRSAKELLAILLYARNEQRAGNLRWEDCVGPKNDPFLPGLHDASWEYLLPLPRVKGTYFDLWEKSNVKAVSGEAPNQTSVVLRVTLGGTSIVLGADSTYMNWHDHRAQTYRYNFKVNASVLKIPHHGSRDDVRPDMFGYWFAPPIESQQRIGLISADGRRHPYPEVLRALQSENIHPYCTNLARVCGGSKIEALFMAPDVPAEVRRIINAGDVELQPRHVQACQGNIHVQLSADGSYTVTPQYANMCGFRGDYDLLGV